MFFREKKSKRSQSWFLLLHSFPWLIYLIITKGPLLLISRRHWEGLLKAISFELLILYLSALLLSYICMRARTYTLYKTLYNCESIQVQHVINTLTPPSLTSRGMSVCMYVCVCLKHAVSAHARVHQCRHACLRVYGAERWAGVKDNNDWILIKCSHPPKSPSCPLPLPAILTPPLQGQMNENEQSCGVIPRVSNQYHSPPPLFLSRLPTRPLSPHSFLCCYNFPILLSSVGSEELTCVWQREIYT